MKWNAMGPSIHIHTHTPSHTYTHMHTHIHIYACTLHTFSFPHPGGRDYDGSINLFLKIDQVYRNADSIFLQKQFLKGWVSWSCSHRIHTVVWFLLLFQRRRKTLYYSAKELSHLHTGWHLLTCLCCLPMLDFTQAAKNFTKTLVIY